MAESGGIVCGGAAHVRGRLGGPIMGFAVRHGRIRWESPGGDVNGNYSRVVVMVTKGVEPGRREIQLKRIGKDREVKGGE
jgi:hypothetical protein